MLAVIKVHVNYDERGEERSQFFRREVVVRQAGLAPIQGNIGARLDLLEARSLVPLLGHRQIDETARTQHTGDLLRQGRNALECGVMHDLHRLGIGDDCPICLSAAKVLAVEVASEVKSSTTHYDIRVCESVCSSSGC
jgi:hypothetical protein